MVCRSNLWGSVFHSHKFTGEKNGFTQRFMEFARFESLLKNIALFDRKWHRVSGALC